MHNKKVVVAICFAAFAVSAAAQVTGSGTSGTVPLFAGSTALGNSPIAVSGSTVGIGTPNPQGTLDVNGNIALPYGAAITTDMYTYRNIVSTTYTQGAYDTTLLYTPGNSPADTSPKMTLLKNGNVGIGTTTPNAPLQVGANVSGFGTGNYTINKPVGVLIAAPVGADGTVGTGLLIDSAPLDTFNQGVAIEMGTSNTTYGHFTSRIVHFGNAINTVGSRLQIQTHSNVADIWNAGIFMNELGSVGIGTTSPAYALDVTGKIHASSGVIYPDGSQQVTVWTGVVCGGDYAESVEVTGGRSTYQPGDVLVIDPGVPSKFLKSAEPYSRSITGVYPTKPGTVGRRQTMPQSPDEVLMAMIGIVPTKVTAENGAIHPGDLLVTSSTLGYAMKGTDRGRMMGAVIGKALGNLDSSTGVIEVVVTLQ